MRKWFGLILVVALAAGCNSSKVPAQAAIGAAETAFGAVKDEAVKYVPDETKNVEDGIAAAKAAFDKGDYQQALTSAQQLPGQITALSSAVAAKKEELTKNWTAMAADLTGTMSSLTAKVTQLGAMKKLPKGMTADTLAQAKSGMAALTQSWTEASDAFKAGNLPDALSKATAVKAKAGELAAQLGVQAGMAGMAGMPAAPTK